MRQTARCYVSPDEWRDAIKFCMGLGTNPTLSKQDQRDLLDNMDGPAHNEDEASQVLQKLGWRRFGNR